MLDDGFGPMRLDPSLLTLLLGGTMVTTVLTFEMLVVLGLLAFTIFLFISEVMRIDLAAILVMVILGGLSYLPNLGNLADGANLFSGFSSNAVISIIAVMVIGAGLDKTGLMSKVATLILKRGGTTETRVIPIVSGTVGVISSFMQNVGAAALFLPVISRISARTGIPMSRLAMPMGFCAILGGTITMVGSSPLILLNDLLVSANQTLPADQKMLICGGLEPGRTSDGTIRLVFCHADWSHARSNGCVIFRAVGTLDFARPTGPRRRRWCRAIHASLCGKYLWAAR